MPADDANVGLIANSGGIYGGPQGSSVAQKLMANNFNVNCLRTNDTLRRDEWKLFDTEIIQIAKTRLVGVQEIMRRGLVYNLPNALGVTRLEWEMDTDMTPAAIGMSGIQRSQDDRLEFTNTGIPIPIIYKDFTLNIRHLEASRKSGQPLDTMMAMKAGRSVAEKIEDVFWNGYAGLGSNNLIYGMTTAAQRNTYTLTGNWGTTGTPAQMLADVQAMITKAYDDHMYGPFMIFTSTNAGINLDNDFKVNGDKTVRERILQVDGIQGIISTSNLANNTVLLVQLTADVVQMINGIQPTMVQWDSHGGMVTHFKIIAIMLPRFRNDSEGQSGIVHGSI